MKIGEKIKELRKQKNVSQEKLAEVVDVSRQVIGQWERGKSEPRVANLNKMAEYFGVSVEYLLSDEEEISVSQSLSEESANPKKSVGMKVLLSLSIISSVVLLFYIVISIIVTVVLADYHTSKDIGFAVDEKAVGFAVVFIADFVLFLVSTIWYNLRKRVKKRKKSTEKTR